jgi:SAM-dependent methyltransferase
MGILGGPIAAAILKRYVWHDVEARAGYEGKAKLESLFGPDIWDEVADKVVLDFGCGSGVETLEVARQARYAIGLDIVEAYLEIARENQARAGISNCTFVSAYNSKVDVILTIDSFEHFDNPEQILRDMARLLKADGKVLVSFGPTWYHPLGHHSNLFIWAHFLLTEKAIMTWRAKYKDDGATHYGEVTGGLNQMTIRRFERLVAQSPLRFESFEAVPIRSMRRLHYAHTREFLTSVVRCTLVHRHQTRATSNDPVSIKGDSVDQWPLRTDG